MVLKSIEQLIEKMEKEKGTVSIEKQHFITKYLLVGYDIEGRNYSRDVILKNQNGMSEFEYAQSRKLDDHKMSNSTRNMFREKLRRRGAMYLSDSLYLLPLQVLRTDDGKQMELADAETWLIAWGETLGVKIHTMANVLGTDKSIENVSKAYYQVLKDRFLEMDQDLDNALEKIQDLQDQVAVDPKKTIRGVHRIVEAIEARTEEAQELISRYGDPKKDQFHLTKIIATTRLIRDIYEKVKDTKEASK